MDTFFEKIAGKFSGADVIKANAEAEAKSMDDARVKISELEKAVSEMRRLSLKCVETNEATGQLVKSAIEKIEDINDYSEGGIDTASLEKIVSELDSLKKSIESSFKSSEEEAHKENVRVYRNVQASVIEELKQQSEAIAIQHIQIEDKVRGLKAMTVITLIFSTLTFLGVAAAVVFAFLNGVF